MKCSFVNCPYTFEHIHAILQPNRQPLTDNHDYSQTSTGRKKCDICGKATAAKCSDPHGVEMKIKIPDVKDAPAPANRHTQPNTISTAPFKHLDKVNEPENLCIVSALLQNGTRSYYARGYSIAAPADSWPVSLDMARVFPSPLEANPTLYGGFKDGAGVKRQILFVNLNNLMISLK